MLFDFLHFSWKHKMVKGSMSGPRTRQHMCGQGRSPTTPSPLSFLFFQCRVSFSFAGSICLLIGRWVYLTKLLLCFAPPSCPIFRTPVNIADPLGWDPLSTAFISRKWTSHKISKKCGHWSQKCLKSLPISNWHQLENSLGQDNLV